MDLKPGDRIRRTTQKGPDPTDPMLDFHLGKIYTVLHLEVGHIRATTADGREYGIPRQYLVPDLFEMVA